MEESNVVEVDKLVVSARQGITKRACEERVRSLSDLVLRRK